MNSATSAALNVLNKTDTYVVTAHDLFKMAPYSAQVVEWLEPWFDSGRRSFAACHIPLSLPYFLSVNC